MLSNFSFYLLIIVAITFIIYGCLCLFTNHMQEEFERYKLSKFRKLTGLLEVFGGVGLLVGIKVNLILQLSSLGLSVLMLCGLIVRIRVKDPILQTLPAFVLVVLSAFLFMKTLS